MDDLEGNVTFIRIAKIGGHLKVPNKIHQMCHITNHLPKTKHLKRMYFKQPRYVCQPMPSNINHCSLRTKRLMPLATQCFPLPHNKSLQLHIPTSQTGWDGLRTSRRLKHQACLPFMHLLSTSPPPLNSLLLPQPRAPNSEPQMLLLQPGEKQTAAFYFDSIKLAAAAAADVPKTQIDPWGRRRKGGMGVCKSQWIRYAYLDAFRVDMTGSGWLNTQPPIFDDGVRMCATATTGRKSKRQLFMAAAAIGSQWNPDAAAICTTTWKTDRLKLERNGLWFIDGQLLLQFFLWWRPDSWKSKNSRPFTKSLTRTNGPGVKNHLHRRQSQNGQRRAVVLSYYSPHTIPSYYSPHTIPLILFLSYYSHHTIPSYYSLHTIPLLLFPLYNSPHTFHCILFPSCYSLHTIPLPMKSLQSSAVNSFSCNDFSSSFALSNILIRRLYCLK